jgi:hypothetical protein
MGRFSFGRCGFMSGGWLRVYAPGAGSRSLRGSAWMFSHMGFDLWVCLSFLRRFRSLARFRL